MKTQRVGIHLVSTLLLLLWGGVMLYFYASGRIANYLPPEGIFRPMVLWGGIGMVVLALYNLATVGAKEAPCCEHEHDHDHDHDHGHGHDHKHDHGHDHGHAHKEGCGHDHSHDHDHGHDHGHGDHHHEHKEGECCGHDHGPAHAQSHEHKHEHEHEHGHSHGCCGHDHDHGHAHAHTHNHDEEGHHGHSHGILEESGTLGRMVAIFLIAVPVAYAAKFTPDRYSSNAIINKGLYAPNYGEGARAEQFSLKRDPAAKPQAAPTPAPANVASVTPPTTPAATTPSGAPKVEQMPPDPSKGPAPAVNTKEVEKQAAKGAEAKSYGTFSLADLKAQVAQSPEGNFMLEVPELYYTAGDKEVQSVLNGQPVETIAQVLPEKVNNEKGTRLRIFRLLVQCCAADARPYSIPVEFGKAAPTEFKDMSWVKVTGKMSYKQEGDQTVPVLEAISIKQAAEPADAMVY
ncbi:hypothetical protein AYO49_01750 [Verrucomicrobiaceae bacterium SCGC AG-212-N21]|nr:hypothetical protein AYO49_01750 [Verrucomicrobiaceae bacterium SCGC AG-212-N21]